MRRRRLKLKAIIATKGDPILVWSDPTRSARWVEPTRKAVRGWRRRARGTKWAPYTEAA